MKCFKFIYATENCLPTSRMKTASILPVSYYYKFVFFYSENRLWKFAEATEKTEMVGPWHRVYLFSERYLFLLDFLNISTRVRAFTANKCLFEIQWYFIGCQIEHWTSGEVCLWPRSNFMAVVKCVRPQQYKYQIISLTYDKLYEINEILIAVECALALSVGCWHI